MVEGLLLGVFDGPREGLDVGKSLVGIAEGTIEGLLLGLVEGAVLGNFEGVRVGLVVGEETQKNIPKM